MTKLSAKVATQGLSKNKLVILLSCFVCILIGVLIYGAFSNNEDNKALDESNQEIYKDVPNTTDDLLQKLIEKKKSASSVAESIVEVPKTSTLQMVPPIVAKSDDSEVSPEEKALVQYHKKQITQKYDSLSSKSLLFSKFPLNKSPSASELKFRNADESSLNEEQETSVSEFINASGAHKDKILTNQLDKSKFVTDVKTVKSDYLSSEIENPKSPYEVKAGSVIPATMVNGLNSDLPGQIIAQVRENVYDSISRKYLLIPQGAKLIGLYDSNVSYGQKRILVAWNRLIYPDGSSINLKAMPGTDLEGYAGFYDEVDNKYWSIFGTSFIMGVITGAMQYSQNNTNANTQIGGLGITTDTNPTVGQTLSGSLGQQLGQTGLALAQKNLNVQPTLIVKPNYPFNVMITADMVLRPLNKS